MFSVVMYKETDAVTYRRVSIGAAARVSNMLSKARKAMNNVLR